MMLSRLILGNVMIHMPIILVACFLGWYFNSIPYGAMALLAGLSLFWLAEWGAILINNAIEADWSFDKSDNSNKE